MAQVVDALPVAPGFVALSRFVVANNMDADVREAFRNRPHLVDDVPGFVRLDVLAPCDRPSEVWLLTYWTDAGSFRTWHGSHLRRESHTGIPKGLKLVPSETERREFDYICN